MTPSTVATIISKEDYFKTSQIETAVRIKKKEKFLCAHGQS